MITISQADLNDCLGAVTRASIKSSLPAFSLVRLDAGTDGMLRLSCFNGETAARAITHAACDEELSVSVDALTLKAVVETLANEIRLSVEQNSLIIKSATNRTTLRIVDEPFPIIGDESLKSIAVLSGNIFRSLMRVLSFASTDSTRQVLQVWHLTLEKESVTAQAADGYSAGTVCESIEGPAEKTSISLPMSFARLIATLVEDSDRVRLSTAGHQRYVFQITSADNSKNLTLATVTTTDNFPSEQIMTLIDGARNSTVAQLNLQQSSLMQSIRMVNAMGTQNTFIKTRDGVAKIASSETETGQARNILEGTAGGEDISVWMSAAFLKKAVEVCKGELIMKIKDGKSPILIEAGNFTAVIMPMLVEVGKDPFPEDEAIAITMPEMAMA